jgi:60 kDa SS-A/Ro ribonucleoprotein
MDMTAFVATRLRDREAQRKAGAMPYQLLAACMNLDDQVPAEVRAALEEALESSLDALPELPGKVVVCIDVSGSMSSPLTGARGGGTTKVSCVDVAALYACAVACRNPGAVVLPFDGECHQFELDPREGVFAASRRLASIGGGGTDCSVPLELLLKAGERVDTIVFLSDNESWMDASLSARGAVAEFQFRRLKGRWPDLRMVCIDLQPYGSVQFPERPEVLNLGGFSDDVFQLVADYAAGRMCTDHWVGEIEVIELPPGGGGAVAP